MRSAAFQNRPDRDDAQKARDRASPPLAGRCRRANPEAAVNFSSAGAKTLGIMAKYVWQAVDYLEIISESGSSARTESASIFDQRMINENIEDKLLLYPNPVIGDLNIELITKRDNAVINLSILDVSGRTIKVIQKNYKSAGNHHLIWDGDSDSGKRANQGIYIIKLGIDDETFFERIVLK